MPDDLGQLQLAPGGFGYGRGRYDASTSSFGGGGFGGRDEVSLEDRAGIAPATPMAVMVPPRSSARALAKGESKEMTTTTVDAAPIEVRSNFAETAYWSPAIVTDGGKATVKVTFPDSLTQWHASALGLTKTVQVGAAESDVATKKDLLVRLQAPRFFVERDQVTISANVHNYTDETQTVKVSLQNDARLNFGIKPIAYKPGDPPYNGPAQLAQPNQEITLDAGQEKRVDWQMKVVRPGDAIIQVTARTATASDGVKLSFPVLVHGVQRFDGKAGEIKGDGTTKIALNFPRERQPGVSRLNVQLNPSLAGQILEALPYLADYPYGCVEQTMSRFLPTVIVQKTLRQSGVDLETLRRRALAYDAQAKDEPIGERIKNSGYSYPQGQPNARDLAEMASQMVHRGRSNNPIYDAKTVDKMTQEGLQRLYTMQRSDGGWGWWPGSGSSDEYMSAYVMYGLATARSAGVAVRISVLGRGESYLLSQLKDEDNLQLLTYMSYALSVSAAAPTPVGNGSLNDVNGIRPVIAKDVKALVTGRLFEQRDRLTPLSKAYLALALDNLGDKTKANVVVRNLENTVVIDDENGTARYKTQPQYWHWWNNDVETVALALRAFDQIEPSNKLAPMLMKWLTLQARGNHYRSTKETAEVVYTLADYVVKNRELDVDYTLKVNLNGKLARTYRVTKENALWFDNRFITGDIFLNDGENTLTIEKSGAGQLYWNAYTEYFSLEEPIQASGNELEVSRRFFKLTRNAEPSKPVVMLPDNPAARPRMPIPIPLLSKSEPDYTRTEIKDGETVQSGDLIEVELVVNARNDYEYLVFEDMKAAGFEPVDLRSGASYGDGLSSNVELRDEKVAFFVDRLPQGRRVLRYRVRAQVPGQFHALPTNGYAMYAPEVRAISDEMRVSVKD